MRRAIFLVLLVLATANSMQALTVEYAQGYYTVPDYFTEVPADDVHGYAADSQARSFMLWDSNGQIRLSVTSYRDISQIPDEKTWTAIASAPEQRLIQEVQASLAAAMAANKATATVEHVEANLAAQKIIATATINASGNAYKLVTSTLLVNHQQSLHLEVYVDLTRFQELLPEVTKIVDSLSANPEFRLK